MKTSYLIILLVVYLSACGQVKNTNSDKSTETNKNMEELDYYPTIEKVHPKARDLMNEEFFYSRLMKLDHLEVMMHQTLMLDSPSGGKVIKM